MSPRPLIKRSPGGQRYAVPGTPPQRVAGLRPQPASDLTSGPEPTPEKRPRGTHADLSADAIAEIRADYEAGRWNQSDLAYIHDVSKNTISRIVRGFVHTEPSHPEQEDI